VGGPLLALWQKQELRYASCMKKGPVMFSLLRVFAVVLLLVTPVRIAEASGSPAAPSCERALRFNASNFLHPTRIDNKWLPLVSGTQFILTGRANTGGRRLTHRVILTVTDLTKVIDGVRTVVLWDRDISAGQLVEAELAFDAQDDDGNVWNLGEYPEEYAAGVFRGAPNTWIAGAARAKAGIQMLAHPRVGTYSYLQGLSPGINFLDCGRVFQMGQKTCVPIRCYKDVLVTDETSPLNPDGAHQRKFYAPGVGNIRISAVNDPEGETLVLARIVHLSPPALAKAREEALKLDRHAYRVSRVYRTTSPAAIRR
jgi:hypothetical protein